MEFLIAEDETKLATFDDTKDLIGKLIEYFTEIAYREDEHALKCNALFPLRKEVINTLICVMYSGRHMVAGTNEEIGETPDEEILLEEEEIGPLIRSDDEKVREAHLDSLTSKYAECVAQYMQKFMALQG